MRAAIDAHDAERLPRASDHVVVRHHCITDARRRRPRPAGPRPWMRTMLGLTRSRIRREGPYTRGAPGRASSHRAHRARPGRWPIVTSSVTSVPPRSIWTAPAARPARRRGAPGGPRHRRRPGHPRRPGCHRAGVHRGARGCRARARRSAVRVSCAPPPRWPAGMRTGWLPIPSHPRGTYPCRASDSARRQARAAGHGEGGAAGQAGRQDAEHGAARVDQRATREPGYGVASVRMYCSRSPAARADRPPDRAHDAHAGHELTAARAAHGEDELSHAGGTSMPLERARRRDRPRGARRGRSPGPGRRAGRRAATRSPSRPSDRPRARGRARRRGRAWARTPRRSTGRRGRPLTWTSAGPACSTASASWSDSALRASWVSVVWVIAAPPSLRATLRGPSSPRIRRTGRSRAPRPTPGCRARDAVLVFTSVPTTPRGAPV